VSRDDEDLRWNEDKQRAMKAKVDRELAKLAKKLGAHCIFAVAFFQDPFDPEILHQSAGGQLPYPPAQFFDRMAQLHREQESLEALGERKRPN
jgi:hypothetical protein